MRQIVFTGSYKPLSEGDLTDFERWLGKTLPKGYRKFLIENNGGHPHKPNLLSPVDCYVQFFFAITSVRKTISLEDEIEKFRSRFPKNIIPICLTGTGDRICLSLADDKIYYYAYEHDFEALRADHRVSSDKFVFLANNINELLGKLTGTDAPVPDEEVSNIGRWGDVQLLDDFLDQGHDINEISPKGDSIVLSAAYERNLKFIKECVKRGANLHGKGVLHAAIFSMEYELVEYLLEQGVDPNERDERGKTPLDDALPPAKGPAVQLLKSRGGVTTTTTNP